MPWPTSTYPSGAVESAEDETSEDETSEGCPAIAGATAKATRPATTAADRPVAILATVLMLRALQTVRTDSSGSPNVRCISEPRSCVIRADAMENEEWQSHVRCLIRAGVTLTTEDDRSCDGEGRIRRSIRPGVLRCGCCAHRRTNSGYCGPTAAGPAPPHATPAQSASASRQRPGASLSITPVGSEATSARYRVRTDTSGDRTATTGRRTERRDGRDCSGTDTVLTLAAEIEATCRLRCSGCRFRLEGTHGQP